MSSFDAAAARLAGWLFNDALPLWWSTGADRECGGFHEALSLEGQPVLVDRRCRVQARQVYVYATAGRLGWTGPWADATAHGLEYLLTAFARPDGLLRASVQPDGSPSDDGAVLYNQAFGLFALAAAAQTAASDRDALRTRASRLLEATQAHFRHDGLGYVEAGDQPFQSNPHMHLLEAALAWESLDGDASWATLADQIVELCLTRFIDGESGALREFFDARWLPAAGLAGRIVEPGHQFEWAWLLERWGRRRDQAGAAQAARRLFAIGSGPGVDRSRGVAINAMLDDFTAHDRTARLWPQTERVKAAAILASTEADAEAAQRLRSEMNDGLAGLLRYFETPVAGLWFDKLDADDRFVTAEPSPASSMYHIVAALEVLRGASLGE